jgi:diguanylate cyclase (GGDEF)-like protein/PAS domain S-box-containing protein
VVIGASAGGLHALRPMVQSLGCNGRAAYVLAQHMAPDQTSHLTELLGTRSVLTVLTAENGLRLQTDHFYICPPHRNIQVIDGQLVLSIPKSGALISPSVDLLFESAATSHGNHAIGVILSGSGQDGSVGAATLGAAGGLLLVQSLQEATQPSMPEAVLASQCPALCGTTSQLADWLNHPEALHELLAEQFDDNHAGSFTELLGLVSRHIGIDLRQYKENTLRRQTVKRYRSLGFTSLADYLAHVKEHPDEITPLHQSFMISVSSFFRDPATFDLLEKILRPVVANKQQGAPLRVWIPACATGEEAYSIALLLSELLGERRGRFDVRVFATDIDQRALEFARAGVYSAEQIASLGQGRRDRWFDREGASWRVSKSLRELCIFSAHDAISNPPFINLDLISCRNLLIYLKPEQQDILLNTFHYALGPDGLLLLEKSESAGFKSRLFETIDSNHKLYRRRTSNTASYARTTHVGMPVNLIRSPMHKSGPATPKTRSMLEMARSMLASEYGPPGVLANTGFEPLHFFGQSRRYFVLPQDSVDFSVFALCRPELRNELKALGYRMLQEPHSVLHGIGTPVQTDAGPMLVRPVLRRVGSAADGSEQNFLISFEETPQPPSSPAEAGSDVQTSYAASLGDAEITRLRQELADTREHLQAVIEELEASNEELQSLNEEVQSSSEELQSSNEELQSSNEELTTLNDELRLKSIEAAQLNTTLGNIQNSIRTALVVVDLDGKITRYNTLAVRIFGLVPNDIGQHLYGIPCHLNLPQLREQVGSVVASGHSLVERVHQRDFHYLMQIDPYRNELGMCTGAVLTFTDMSELNRAEVARQASEARFRHVWEASTEGMLVVDANATIVLTNPALEHMFGYPTHSLVGQPVNMLVPPEMHAPHRDQMQAFIDGTDQARPMGRRWQISGRRQDGTELALQISLTTMTLDGSRHVLATLADVTDRQRAEAALIGSEQHLRLALDASQSGTWEWLLDSNNNIWSEQLWSLYGLDPGRHPPCYASWLGAIHPNDRTRVSDTVSRAADQGAEFEIEWRVNLPATETQRWLMARGRPVPGSSGRPYKYLGIVMDITSRKASEARLQLAASVFTHAQEGILITDPDNRIIEVNDTFCALTGFERAQVLGQDVQTLIAEPQRTELLPLVCEELTYRGQWHGEASIQRADGSVFPVMLNSSVVRGDTALPQCYVSLFSDISTIKEHQRQLEHVAHYDPLTGLANRVLLADRLQHAMVQAKRRNRHLALVYLDLDGFKAVNDSHGHDVGDRLLVVISGLLRAALRQGDTLARLGGDEFVAVLSDLTHPAEHELVVTRLLQAAATPVQLEQQAFQLSASLGVTLFPLDSGDADTLLRHADQAMYQAKLAGKNRYHLFDPEHDRRTRNRWDSLQHIAQALAGREFVLHYQPKVNMRSGALVGVEALVRWQHPERGLLAPCEFLPLIEDQPLIAELGSWVLDAALDQAPAWRQAGLALQISVNIAPLHLQQGDFVERLQDKLASRPDLPPAHLELEVLETAALHNITTLSQTLSRVRQLGVQIALDDFGTGYSSLTYLKRLPASVLKIDQSFVRDMLLDAEDLAIVDGVIGLATTFHRSVVAEGVESIEHGELLLRLGCELAQGYGIARPMPADALPGWAGQWQPAAAWTDQRNRPLTREELPAIYAEVSLRQWLRWLENRATGVCEPPPPLGDDPCRFGRWFHSEGQQRFGHLAEFVGIGTTRDRVHALAEAQLRQSADGEPADPAQQAELDALCAQLLERLQALSAAMWRSPDTP